jgi:hypothetical protein
VTATPAVISLSAVARKDYVLLSLRSASILRLDAG